MNFNLHFGGAKASKYYSSSLARRMARRDEVVLTLILQTLRGCRACYQFSRTPSSSSRDDTPGCLPSCCWSYDKLRMNHPFSFLFTATRYLRYWFDTGFQDNLLWCPYDSERVERMDLTVSIALPVFFLSATRKSGLSGMKSCLHTIVFTTAPC